jgi:hypothetical protein
MRAFIRPAAGRGIGFSIDRSLLDDRGHRLRRIAAGPGPSAQAACGFFSVEQFSVSLVSFGFIRFSAGFLVFPISSFELFKKLINFQCLTIFTFELFLDLSFLEIFFLNFEF